MTVKPEGLGRPPLALRDNPQRYLLTYYEAKSRLTVLTNGKGKKIGSRTFVSKAVALAWRGEMVNTPENLAAMGDPKGSLLFKMKRHIGSEGKRSDQKSACHAEAALIQRSARKICCSKNEDDWRWWLAMLTAWTFAMGGKTHLLAFAGASAATRVAEESEFFDRVLAPIVNHRFGLGPQPAFALPDFETPDLI